METLKLHHIAPYLPYGLKCQTVDRGEVVISELNAAYSDNSYTFMNIVESEKGFDDIKPLLKPMSALNISYVAELARYVSTLDEKYTIEIAMKMIEERKSKPLNMPYVIVQILLQWHFDVFGLIDKGLAKNIWELESETLIEAQ